jgi:hypothetical protein
MRSSTPDAISAAVHRFSETTLWPVVFVLALIPRLVLVLLRPYPFECDEMCRVGLNFGRFGYLGNPFIVPTGPTAHVAPVYPVILGTLYRITGSGPAALGMARVVSAIITAVAIAFLPTVSRRLGLGRLTGLIAAALFIPPIFVWLETGGEWETPYTALALMTGIAASMPTLLAGRGRVLTGLLHGAVWGLGLLISPTIATVYVAVHGIAVGRWRANLRNLAPYVAASALGAAAVVGPYVVRVHKALGGFAFIRSNFGLELDVSNNDLAKTSMRENLQTGNAMATHPYQNSAEARRLRAIGELSYYRLRREAAFHWIRSHPARFLRLSMARTARFWIPAGGRWYHLTFCSAMLVGSALALVTLSRRNGYLALQLTASLLAYSAVYSLIQAELRYVYPIVWLTVLLTASLIVWALERFGLIEPRLAGNGAPAALA